MLRLAEVERFPAGTAPADIGRVLNCSQALVVAGGPGGEEDRDPLERRVRRLGVESCWFVAGPLLITNSLLKFPFFYFVESAAQGVRRAQVFIRDSLTGSGTKV